jgi:hypothetical protein
MEDNNPAGDSPSKPEALDALLERWWEDHFPGSAVARDTQAWNVAHAAKETLKRLLAQARGDSPGDKVLKGSV